MKLTPRWCTSPTSVCQGYTALAKRGSWGVPPAGAPSSSPRHPGRGGGAWPGLRLASGRRGATGRSVAPRGSALRRADEARPGRSPPPLLVARGAEPARPACAWRLR